MKLIGSHTSPFTRKVRIVLAEKKIDYDFVIDSPWTEDSKVPDINPLGKIPVLVLKDGSTLIDSPVICEYLNDLGGGKLFPGMSLWREVSGRWRALTLQALGDGICDAAVARIYEGRRPPEQQSEAAVHKHVAAITRSLDVLERARFAEAITIGEIAVACALGYLDFRLPELDWRQTRPNLRDWYEKFAQYPSMKDTWPANPA